MAWRLAKSIQLLLNQVNNAVPHRRKDSDGGIGDAAHATRNSDHNPYIKVGTFGIVRAYDFTHAPETGFDAYAFAEMLLKNKDSRIRYVISNRKIASGKAGPKPWEWRKYEGTNPHIHHTHVSVTEDVGEFDSMKSWNISNLPIEASKRADETANYVPPPTTLRQGSRGELVKKMQIAIGTSNDGFFGPATKAALIAYQKNKGLPADGICGPATWDKING